MHHFHFTRSHPGSVIIKNASDESETEIDLLKDVSWNPSKDDLPPVINPPGLPLKRQWYLYNKLREFCPDDAKDLVCPLPAR